MPVASCRKRPAAEISESSYDDDFYIESLTFPQAQFRLEEISSAHEKTCEWILGRPEYLTWMSEESLPNHGGFFWIKGKPGAGKSTIMKYLLLNAKKALHDTVILSFFFHAQGTLLERSVMGMYRSLSHQLLHSRVPPDARITYLNVAKRLELQDGNLVWTKRDVKNLLSLTIKSLQGRHILFLIDAVDECDQAEVEDMTTFFQELGKSAVEHTVYLRICLASRHYPHITLDKGIEVIIEDQQEHEEDLRKYVETKLKGGRSSLIQGIRKEICERADGVFLWVMLVVRSLNEAFDRGNISALRKRLDEIPDGLDNLFTDILTRDQKDMHVLIFSLQLILFGRRRRSLTLTREELYFAVLFEKTNVIENYIDPELHSTTVMDRLVLDVTKGLVENAKQSGRAKPPRVRFIHESVRDFLLRRNGLTIIQSQRNDSTSFIGVSHDRLKQFCFDYISGVLSLCQPCSGREFLVLRDAPQGEREDASIQKAFPFLDYAIRKVLEHSDLAQEEGISQKEFLYAYSNRFSDFKRVYNAVEKYATRQYKDDWSLLYVMAHSDLRHLIQAQLLGESHAWDLGGQYICPMGAAFRNGNMASVRALLGLQPDSQPQSLNVAIEPEMVSRMKQFFVELDGQTKQSKSKVKQSQRLLSFAFEGKCVSILRLLLFTNLFDFNVTLVKSRRTPLSWSILNREPGLVELLVSEAKVNIQAHIKKADSIKKPLLREAFSTELSGHFEWREAHRRILDILLRQDSLDLKCQDEKAMNAVHWAALANDESSLKRLIKRGFDYAHCDSTGRDPLSHAAEYGHVNIVKTLLEIEGIEVDRGDQSGRTPLTWALEGRGGQPVERKMAVIEDLFKTNRVDFNARDRNLKSPLASAVERGHPGGVEILLNFDSVDVNSRDLYGRTPLIMAVIRRDTTSIEYLLRCDRIDVDAQDTDGRTALSWAMGPLNFPCTMKGYVSASYEQWGSYIDAAKLLLASRTPDTGLADVWGHPPTWWETAYKIVLAELGGDRSQENLRARPSLQSLLEDSHSPPGGAAIVQYMELETIKSEMQRFLDGKAFLNSRVKYDLRYQNVKFGTDSVLEGTEIKTNIICSLW
jgi:ankyrin repeat protein